VGKTSFLKAICGLDNFSYKNIYLKNIPTYFYKQLFLDVIVFVPEHINLELRNFIDYVFGEKKYDTDCNFIDTFNSNISIDQLFQNKIAISQAVYKLLYIVLCLSKKPEVILLDEPSIKFNSTEFKIFSEVLKIVKTNKKIAIITSNDARVLNLASKKFFFNDSQNLSLVK
jgi:translation initiation factor RLI1